MTNKITIEALNNIVAKYNKVYNTSELEAFPGKDMITELGEALSVLEILHAEVGEMIIELNNYQ